jgi:membrane-bound metal-dependent hydrolase YbcI (DUF457 family)
MFILAHLLVGVLIGVLLYLWRHERWLILAAAVGSILPDLIDKPLGHLLLPGLDYGRIYFHTLIFLLAFFIIGYLIWWKYRSFIGFAFALGMLSHQVLDLMWLEWWNWLWPFFGPFRGEGIENFFLYEFIREVTNFSEWLAAVAILVILLGMAGVAATSEQPPPAMSGIYSWSRDHPRLIRTFAGVVIVLLSVTGVYSLYCGVTGIPCILTGFDNPADNYVITGVLLSGAVILGWIGFRE